MRLEIPYGRMRRRIELPAGTYTLIEHRLDARLPVSAPGGVKPMNTSETQPPSTVLPEDVLIILPVRDLVLFPGVVLPIAVSGKRALAAAQEAVRTQRRVGLILQTEPTAMSRIPRNCTGSAPSPRSSASSRRATALTI